MKDQTRNLNPHKPARIAMVLWNKRYADQRAGSMAFWESLSEAEKEICREIVEQVKLAPEERG